MKEHPVWIQSDHQLISCKEKVKVLNENYTELVQVMQDCFEDALIMGVDEQDMRNLLKQIADQLRSPIV